MAFFNNVTVENEEILEKRKSELKASLKGLEGEQKDILNKFKAIKSKAKPSDRNINYNFLVKDDREEFLDLLDTMYSYVKRSEENFKKNSGLISGITKAIDWLTGTKFQNEVKKPIKEYINFVVTEYGKIREMGKDKQIAQTNSAAKLVKLMYVNMGVVQNNVKKYIQYRYAKNNSGFKTENQINIQDYEYAFLKILFSIAGIRSENTDLNNSKDKGIFERLVTNTIRTIEMEYHLMSKSY